MDAANHEIITSIGIDAPIDVVWQKLTDFAGYSDWNPYLIRVEGMAEAGTTITVHQVPRPGADIIVAPADVVEIAPYNMRWIGGLPDRAEFKGDHRFELTEAQSGVNFIHHEQFSGRQADTILAAYGAIIRDNFERFNRALKAACEEAKCPPRCR
jgi:hypothetical protein